MKKTEDNARLINEINHAAYDGDIPQIKRLTAQSTEALKPEDWQCAVYGAASRDHLETLRFLLDECNAQLKDDEQGHSVLKAATENASLNLVRYLVEERKLNAAQDVELLDRATDNKDHRILCYLAGIQGVSDIKEHRELLEAAMRNCRLDVIRYLIEECGVDVNLTDEDGESFVSIAACYGDLELLRYLVEQCHADIYQVDDGGDTILKKAVRFSDQEGQKNIRYLIENGAFDVNDGFEDGETILDIACSHMASLPLVRYLVETCHAKIRRAEHGRESQLHQCARNNADLEILDYFIREQGLDPHAVTEDGQTVLHAAFHHWLGSAPDLELIQYLVETCRLNPTARDKEGNTPLHLACRHDDPELIRYLVTHASEDANEPNHFGVTPLFMACKLHDTALIRFLIQECKADVHTVTKSGNTLLHAAAMNRDPEVLRLLIDQYGLDIEAKNDMGMTCIFNAGDRLDTLRYLIQGKHASCQMADQEGNTLLHHVAADTDDTIALDFLVKQCHLDVHAKNKAGATVLHFAAMAITPEIMKHLVDAYGLDPLAKDDNGYSAIVYATYAVRHENLKALVNTYGLDVNAKDNLGRTPLMLAVADGNPLLVQTLVKLGADPDVRDPNGQTCLHQAAADFHNPSMDILRYLVQHAGADVHAKDNDGRRPVDLHTPIEARQYLKRVTAQAAANEPFHPYQSMLSFLTSREQVDMPAWLRDYRPGDRPSIRLMDRTVYYPGALFDYQPLRLFADAGSAHVFIYLDYMKDSYRPEDFDSQEGNAIIPGYTVIGTVAYDLQRDLAQGSFLPHMTSEEMRKATSNSFERHDPFARLVVCERNGDNPHPNAAQRIAVLFIAADGIVSYDMLFANRNMPAPFTVVLQDHALGGNYDRFGRGGILDAIVTRSGIRPQYLLAGQTTHVWDGYEPVPDTESIIGASQHHQRTLFRRAAH